MNWSTDDVLREQKGNIIGIYKGKLGYIKVK